MNENLPQRRNIRLKEYDYSTTGYYFVTICAATRGRPVFGDMKSGVAQIHLNTLGETARDCLEAIPGHVAGVSVDIYCVMPDHIHVILVLEQGERPPCMAALQDKSKQLLPRTVEQYKAAVTRQSHHSGLWQSGYYDHVIRNDTDLAETRAYIQNNPAKEAL